MGASQSARSRPKRAGAKRRTSAAKASAAKAGASKPNPKDDKARVKRRRSSKKLRSSERWYDDVRAQYNDIVRLRGLDARVATLSSTPIAMMGTSEAVDMLNKVILQVRVPGKQMFVQLLHTFAHSKRGPSSTGKRDAWRFKRLNTFYATYLNRKVGNYLTESEVSSGNAGQSRMNC